MRNSKFNMLLLVAGCALSAALSGCYLAPREEPPPLPRCSSTRGSARIGVQHSAGSTLPGITSTSYRVSIYCRDDSDQVVTAGGTFVEHLAAHDPGFSPWFDVPTHDSHSSSSDLSFAVEGPLQGLWCFSGTVALANGQEVSFNYSVPQQLAPPVNAPLAPGLIQRDAAGALSVSAAGAFAHCPWQNW